MTVKKPAIAKAANATKPAATKKAAGAAPKKVLAGKPKAAAATKKTTAASKRGTAKKVCHVVSWKVYFWRLMECGHSRR